MQVILLGLGLGHLLPSRRPDSLRKVKLSAQALLADVAIVGLLVGFLGAIGWRYATRRLVVIDNPPSMNPGDKGFMFTGSPHYVAGPPWWPGLLLLPATGVIVAAAVGVAFWYALKPISRPWTTRLLRAATSVATGIGVGIAAVLLTHEDRPSVLVRIGAPSEAPLLTDDQWDRELAPIGLWFPLIGILSALLIAVLLHGVHRMWQRH